MSPNTSASVLKALPVSTTLLATTSTTLTSTRDTFQTPMETKRSTLYLVAVRQARWASVKCIPTMYLLTREMPRLLQDLLWETKAMQEVLMRNLYCLKFL